MIAVDLSIVVPIHKATLATNKTVETRIVNLLLVTIRIKIIMWVNANGQDLVHNLQAVTKTFIGI